MVRGFASLSARQWQRQNQKTEHFPSEPWAVHSGQLLSLDGFIFRWSVAVSRLLVSWAIRRWCVQTLEALVFPLSHAYQHAVPLLFCCCCSIAKSSPTFCDPMDSSTPGFPVLHYLPEFAQTHVHWADDAIQPSHPLSPPSPSVHSLSQHQGLFQWVDSSHQVAKVLELQLQHQLF